MNRRSAALNSVFLFGFILAGGMESALADPAVSLDPKTKSVLVVANGNAIRLQPWSPGTLRIEAAPGTTLPEKKSLSVIALPDPSGWTVQEEAERVLLKSVRMSASVDKKTGLVSFFAADGSPLLQQTAWSFQPAQDKARDGLAIQTAFAKGKDEHLYGGGVLADELRKPSSDIPLINNNTQIRNPVLYSSMGYGIFCDNTSRGKLRLRPDSVTWESSAGDMADFYVMAGPEADAVVGEYRNLTGEAPLFPKWAYGFWFSKNRFNSQREILAVAKAFREHQFPVDLIVQDYYYWKPDGGIAWGGWGSHHFVESRYPDVKGMIDQLHGDFHMQFMTVIWPRFDVTTEHAKELDAAQALYPTTDKGGIGEGTRFYDPFSVEGRKIYGRQVMESLLPLGVDAWWMDGAEPEIPNHIMAKFDTGSGPASRLMNAYPLLHTEAVYQAQRGITDHKRAVLLPRSAWAGMQRYAAANWTGDIDQDWATLAGQIESLCNYSISGLPYITTDVGGYTPTPEADRELFIRWFQWGTFSPIFRVHGQGRPTPWEYGPEAEVILKNFDMLRYRLLPYIYSQAAEVTFKKGTLLRPLVMDFRNDPEALNVWDEFMFGPSLLVAPVYKSLREPGVVVDQISDLQRKPGGVTATFQGKDFNVELRKDLSNRGGFQFRGLPSPEQGKAENVLVKGVFTPKEDGPMALEVCEPRSNKFPVNMILDGAPVSSSVPAGDWQFPLFKFQAKKDVPVSFSIETKMKYPFFRIVRVNPGPLLRDVYLPGQGGWYDFWTGEKWAGSKKIRVETPLDKIPLYVRAGAILPMGPEKQYAAEHPEAPIELRIYRGADGLFQLYEDEGDNYDYEKGSYAIVPISWNEQNQKLTLGVRKGSFPGMLEKRSFHVVWVRPGQGSGEAVTEKADAVIAYEGREISVKAPTP